MGNKHDSKIWKNVEEQYEQRDLILKLNGRVHALDQIDTGEVLNIIIAT